MAENVSYLLNESFFGNSADVEGFRPSLVANCVFNSFLSYTTIILNILTIHAIRKTALLPKPLRTLLLSLAASDVGVGLLAQPLFISILVSWLKRSRIDPISFKGLMIDYQFQQCSQLRGSSNFIFPPQCKYVNFHISKSTYLAQFKEAF